jgi:hypothetical protein
MGERATPRSPQVRRRPLKSVLLVCAAPLLLLPLLGGCAAQKAERQRTVDFGELLNWLPGTYDDTAQADHDVHQGIRPPHDRVQLVVVAVPAPRLGHHVFYVQEMAADDAQRVMSERFWNFENDEDTGAITQTIYTPKEPIRWRDGQKTPDLFTGIVKDDVDTTIGCKLLWKRVGDHFEGANDPKICHVPGMTRTEMKFQLTADALDISDTETDTSGRVVRGGYYDPYTRFRKTK